MDVSIPVHRFKPISSLFLDKCVTQYATELCKLRVWFHVYDFKASTDKPNSTILFYSYSNSDCTFIALNLYLKDRL